VKNCERKWVINRARSCERNLERTYERKLGEELSLKENRRQIISFRTRAILAAMVLFMSAAALSCSPIAWVKDFVGIGSAPVSAPRPSESIGEIKPAGEDQFLSGDFKSAKEPLLNAGQNGSLRALFFLRIIVEYGLDGQAPDPEQASRILTALANSKERLTQLALYGPEESKPIYTTALAHLYFKSYFAPLPDYGVAVTLARRAAASEFTPAMNLAAAIILTPQATQATEKLLGGGPSEAFSLIQRAAEIGDVLAMANLSYLYRSGIGAIKDDLIAASWARRAATKEQTTARCLNDLGYFHQLGFGVSQDKQEAARWYKLAADRHYPPAAANAASLDAKEPTPPSVFDGLEF
jgi:TPR repeat protein